MSTGEDKFLLKDHLFNKKKVESLADEILPVYPEFARDQFIKDTVTGFKDRELKARISWMAETLKKHLPDDYRRALRIILRALPPPMDPSLADDDFGDFIYAPYNEFVAQNGCHASNLTISLKALHALTMRFSAEDAIRYFLNAFPEETMEKIHEWKYDSHYHVRRLCSEGLRPRLPWAKKIKLPSALAIPVLDELFADSTRFVTRSVANHLNDISKENPSLVLETLRRWKATGKQNEKEIQFIVRHSLRGLIKDGHPGAMKALGYSPEPPVAIRALKMPEKVRMGTSLEFQFQIEAKKSCKLIVDYLIYFRNKAGKLNRGKVFKLKALSIKNGETILMKKSHKLQEKLTTRKMYRGEHGLEIQINGKSFGRKKFDVY
ncbi:MAG TPA: DNA alkylation repair protein [Leptospiraceae bacterium]|mgnify:FL=1|nr:DNA alkylation repair protein [Spirochaetaceae bacterium]HBS04384.1 DNA alkylation repair protein [Leptospiraceae bacterium]|tara:strand:+ start:24661 stop:25794 length:1134 start_codon:yes stop_codon:yes gene_type:complete